MLHLSYHNFPLTHPGYSQVHHLSSLHNMVEPYLEPQYRIPITQTLLPPKVTKPLQKSPEVLPSKTKEKLNRGPYRPETPDSGPEQTSDSDSEEEWPLVMRFDSIIPITSVYCLLPTSYSLLYVSFFCF